MPCKSKSEREKRINELCTKAGVKYDDYVKALQTTNKGYTVVLQRDIDETFINPYNEEWMRAWNANLDLQPVLDFFAIITYVTDYYSKGDEGRMEVIKAMLKETQCETLQEKMRLVEIGRAHV